MRAVDRATARKSLDRRLSTIRKLDGFERPHKGWIKAIREALGMTAAQLAARIGVATPRVYQMEKAEVAGGITLTSLQRAANELECELVYALVPKSSLDDTVKQQARSVAEKRLLQVAHSMALEDQRVEDNDQAEQANQLVDELIAAGSVIWKTQ